MTGDIELLLEELDRLRLEVAELRASRRRLVLAADADRRRIERELHDGLQQELVALAVNLQHARRLVDVDPVPARTLLDEMRQDVQEALDGIRELAHRIYPPLLEAGGLTAALRTAAVSAGASADVQVTADATGPPEVAATLYFCCVEALEHVGTEPTVTVREQDGSLAFEIAGSGAAGTDFGGLRERVEALGGRLTIEVEPGQGTRISVSLPMS